MPDRSAHLAGIGLMLLATLMFSLNDVWANGWSPPTPSAQILFLRGIAALLILSPFIMRAGLAAFRNAPQPGLQVLRAVLATTEVACFYLSVWYLPLADAMTFYLAGPIYVTAMSALFLGEKVGIYRWSAVLVGFVGVVIALNPPSGSLRHRIADRACRKLHLRGLHGGDPAGEEHAERRARRRAGDWAG